MEVTVAVIPVPALIVAPDKKPLPATATLVVLAVVAVPITPRDGIILVIVGLTDTGQ